MIIIKLVTDFLMLVKDAIIANKMGKYHKKDAITLQTTHYIFFNSANSL